MARLALIEVPQWQGSSSPAARRLAGGAAMLAGLLNPAQPGPARQQPSLHLRPELASGAGMASGGVRHAAVLAANLAAVQAAVTAAGELTPVVVGGDCGVELAPAGAASRRFGGRLVLVWFDAHGDLNTPQSSPSGAFHGMVLRALLGDVPPPLRPDRPLAPGQVVLAGVRSLDPAEREFIRRHRIRHLGPADLAAPGGLVEAVAATGASAVYLHIDLDVLDPGEFGAVGIPEPGGITVGQLAAAVQALAARFAVAGIGITEFQPAGPADQVPLAPLALAVSAAAAGPPPG